MRKRINVTQPFLPPLSEFMESLEDIWDSKWLTNDGKFHTILETRLAEFLGVKYVSLFTNGTLAIMTAMQTLRITGEVITTPYSFVATTHALYWNGITPVFVDIDPHTCNIDPNKIVGAITNKTTAILPVHVYGYPCDVKKIKDISDKFSLKVIYDAAHAFGVKYENSSLMNWGDLSILSFHATKVFNTFEGGAIISHDLKTKKRIDQLKNFGFVDEVTVMAPGINAKMNEFSSALGLHQLKYYNRNLEKRRNLWQLYKDLLHDVPGITHLEEQENVSHNYSYFPVFIDKNQFGIPRDEVYQNLKRSKIFSRRYFYPLISQFQPYSEYLSARHDNLLSAHHIAESVLCLPFYTDLSEEEVKFVCAKIKELRPAKMILPGRFSAYR